jgi:hypothetical protein
MCASALVGPLGSAPAGAVLPCPRGSGGLFASDDSYTFTLTTLSTSFSVTDPNLGLLANDDCPSSGSVDLDWSDDTSWGGASVSVHANGTFTYKPDPSAPFTGEDSFDYWTKDSDGDGDFATVTIVVKPAVKADTYYTKVNAGLNVAAPGVFANDVGIDPASALVASDTSSAHGGTVAVNDDGSFSYQPPLGYQGSDSFTYTVSDIDGDNNYVGTVTVRVDSTPPVAVIVAPTQPTSLTSAISVSWTATDASGIARYDVQTRHAAWNGSFSTWSTWKSATTAKSATLSGTGGQSYCIRARATDRAGNTSAWTSQRCIAVPLKSTSLGYSGPWVKSARSDVYGGTIYTTTTKGARVQRTGAHATRLYIVATKCASCGTVSVQFNGATIASANLANATTARKQIIAAGSFSSVRTGTVTITVTSATGKSVGIEGLAVLQT